MNAAIGTAIGVTRWDGKRQLVEVEALRALQAIGELSERRWLRELSPDECQALLGGIEIGTLRRASHFFDAVDVPTKDLVSTWHETGLAVVGGALLGRIEEKELERWHAVPSRIEQPELEKLVGHLAKAEKGLDQLMILLRHGFLQEGRRPMIEAIVAVDSRPQFLFETVLEHEEVDAQLLVPVLRQELDRLARWKGLGPGVRDALSLGLREPKGALERFLSQFWRGDASAEGEASASGEQHSH